MVWNGVERVCQLEYPLSNLLVVNQAYTAPKRIRVEVYSQRLEN